MTNYYIALAATLLIGTTAPASALIVSDKDASTAVGSCSCGPTCGIECAGACPSNCPKTRSCLMKLRTFFSYCPLEHNCCCKQCLHCSSCAPPLYVYFLTPCQEGAGCAPCAKAACTAAPCVAPVHAPACTVCDAPTRSRCAASLPSVNWHWNLGSKLFGCKQETVAGCEK